jgi:hypothetical protein
MFYELIHKWNLTFWNLNKLIATFRDDKFAVDLPMGWAHQLVAHPTLLGLDSVFLDTLN